VVEPIAPSPTKKESLKMLDRFLNKHGNTIIIALLLFAAWAIGTATAHAQTNPNDVYVNRTYTVAWDHPGTGLEDASKSGFRVQVNSGTPVLLPATARQTNLITCPASPATQLVSIVAFNEFGASSSLTITANCIATPAAPPQPTGIRIIRTTTSAAIMRPDGTIEVVDEGTTMSWSLIYQ
jgi:hypothetical protein